MRLTVPYNDINYQLFIHQEKTSLPYLLLLHGFMGSGCVFEHLIEEICTFANPITLDLAGHGRTGAPADPRRFSLQNQLDDMHEILTALPTPELFLHGYSMGGRLALRVALQYPDLLAGLIIESSTYGIESIEDQDQRNKLEELRARQIEKNYKIFLKEWQKLPLFDNGLAVPGVLQDRYNNIQYNQDPSLMAASLRGFGTGKMSSVKEQLQILSMPVLLMAGERDQKYRKIMDNMEMLIPDSKFHIIKNAGHRIHLENPEAFCKQLKAFILSSLGND